MGSKVKFKNSETVLEPSFILLENRYIQGAERSCLSFKFKGDMSLDELDNLFSPENCSTICLIDDEGSEFYYDNYVLRDKLLKTKELVTPETAQAPAVYEDYILCDMAQKTFSETLIDRLIEAVYVANDPEPKEEFVEERGIN